MGRKINYPEFLKQLDERLKNYYAGHDAYIVCRAGCCSCCEKGDYPLSNIELDYMMQGYIALDSALKQKVQNNIYNIKKGGACPFLIDKLCSIYEYRPIVCRVHGLSYLLKDGRAKVPYCVNDGKNYSSVYKEGELLTEPIKEDLESSVLISCLNPLEIRNLYDWVAQNKY